MAGWTHKGNGSSNGQRGLGRKRRMCGMSQHELSRQTGIAFGKLVRIETGRTDATPEELGAIRAVLKRRAKQAMEAVA